MVGASFSFGASGHTVDLAQTPMIGQPPTDPVYDSTPPEIVKLQAGLFQVGQVLVDKTRNEIRIKGRVNMSDGLVEYIACTPYGKLHESVLSLDANPYHIQIALLLMGLKPGDRPIDSQGSELKPCGDPLVLTVSWKEKGQLVAFPPEALLLNINTGQTMGKSDWVFSGSQILEGRYMALQEGSIVASYHDPLAIIDHRDITGADDTLFYANKHILPPAGTPIEFRITPVSDPRSKLRTQCNEH